jgi:hypothetical protein
MNMKNENNITYTIFTSSITDVIGYGARNINQLENFLGLLKNHPHFRSQVKELRNKNDLDGPFNSQKEYRDWKHNLSKVKKFELEPDFQSILEDFNIPSQFLFIQTFSMLRDFFAYFPNPIFEDEFHQLILSKSEPFDKDKRGASSSRIFLPSVNKETHTYRFSPNSFYIEVNEWNTKEEVMEAYDKIKPLIPDIPKLKNSPVQEFIWIKSEFEGWSGKKIARFLAESEEYPEFKKTDATDESEVSKLKNRYRKKLEKLGEI